MKSIRAKIKHIAFTHIIQCECGWIEARKKEEFLLHIQTERAREEVNFGMKMENQR